MSEYTNVEHPFLEKLREIGWQVIDKGSGGIPQDPTESMFDYLQKSDIVKLET